jgi:putative spermidine/putrescine transport system substrate-binding protein
MIRRQLFAAAALLAASSVANARDLTVVARGETMPPAARQIYLQPFSVATGIRTRLKSWNGGLDALTAQIKAPDNTWDVVEVNADELASGCADGTFQRLDWSAIGGKAHYQPQGVSDCGVGATMSNLVLAWDRDKFQTAPSWADFWDVAKYPGKRGLRRGVRGNLEFALMADGVAPADVYKVLATSDGVDRAFRKLDQLKPYIVWWQNGAEAAHILGSGAVLMTTAPSGWIATANWTQHRNFGIQWNASFYQVHSWAILKDSPNTEQAKQFLYFIGTPALEGRLFQITGDPGLAFAANDGLPHDQLAASPTNPANLKAAMPLDTAFWHANLAKLRQRFDAWLAGH